MAVGSAEPHVKTLRQQSPNPFLSCDSPLAIVKICPANLARLGSVFPVMPDPSFQQHQNFLPLYVEHEPSLRGSHS